MDKDGYLTNAGVLLADQNIYTHSRIFCTRWNGLTKTSINGEAVDDKEISGGLLQQLFSAIEFVRNNTKKKWHKSGMTRVETPEYDEEAVREAIVNGIIHREYTRLGAEVCVDIYDDRLEVTSPGSMMSGKTIDKEVDVVVASERRNPVLADIFARMKLMERRGSGLKKITDNTNALFADGNNHVEYFSDRNYFKVTIYNALYGKKIGDKPNVTDVTKTATEAVIIDAITQNPKITIDQLAEKLQVNRRTILRVISLMKQNGLIKRIGSSRNGYWKI